jgi:hypothetical protein
MSGARRQIRNQDPRRSRSSTGRPRDYARFRREIEICEDVDAGEIAILPVYDSATAATLRRTQPGEVVGNSAAARGSLRESMASAAQANTSCHISWPVYL